MLIRTRSFPPYRRCLQHRRPRLPERAATLREGRRRRWAQDGRICSVLPTTLAPPPFFSSPVFTSLDASRRFCLRVASRPDRPTSARGTYRESALTSAHE